MRHPPLHLILAVLATILDQTIADTPQESIGKLPVCAQACITSAFATCKCKILDFTCACNCNAFRPFSESCTNTSCADSYLKPVLDAVDGTCQSFASSAIALPATSTMSTSSGLRTTTRASSDLSVTGSSVTTDSPTANSIQSGPNIAGPTGIATDTGASGSSELRPTKEGVSTGPEFYPQPTTTAQYTYSYCFPGSNATAGGWNATAYCTGMYNGPMYTGNMAAGRWRDDPWILSLMLFIVGLRFW